MGDKEKVKDFNRIFNYILNKFPADVQPHNTITKYYYTTSFPTILLVFVKRDANDTLDLNFVEVVVVEKDLNSIGEIEDHEDSKDFKDAGKKIQASPIKAKEKYSFDVERLEKYLKSLTNAIS